MRPTTWTRPIGLSPAYRPAPILPPMRIVPQTPDFEPGMASMPVGMGADPGDSSLLVHGLVVIAIGAVAGAAIYKAYAHHPTTLGTVASALVGPMALGAMIRVVTGLTPA